MPERFLHPLPSPLQEAPPRRRVPWFYRHGWTPAVGLCVGFAVYTVVFDGRWVTGLGFLTAGAVIYTVFRRVE